MKPTKLLIGASIIASMVAGGAAFAGHKLHEAAQQNAYCSAIETELHKGIELAEIAVKARTDHYKKWGDHRKIFYYAPEDDELQYQSFAHYQNAGHAALMVITENREKLVADCGGSDRYQQFVSEPSVSSRIHGMQAYWPIIASDIQNGTYTNAGTAQ